MRKEGNTQELHCKILIEAANKYLRWRENKNIPNGHGYKFSLFTRVRHFSSFGAKRARKLINSLSSDPMPNSARAN